MHNTVIIPTEFRYLSFVPCEHHLLDVLHSKMMSAGKGLNFRDHAETGVALSNAAEDRHILLVAGPAGSGKSTFMQQLRSHGLPKEIVDLLPPGCEDWPHISGKLLLAGRQRECASRVIMHYDIMRPFSLGLRDYSSDKALSIICSCNSWLTVISLSVPADILIAQYMARAISTGHRVRVALHRFTGSRRALLGRKRSRLVALYEQPNALDHWMSRWDAFLEMIYTRNAQSKKFPMCLISASPCAPADGQPNFRLLSVAK